MDKKYIKITVFSLMSLGVVYGGYKLVKYLTTPKKFNGDKVISKGSEGSEAKTIQQTLNNIISDAGKAKSNDATKESRRKEVAILKPLTLDGVFDADSVSVLKVIMGKDSASYNEVRDKRLAFAKAYGLGNPYAK
jgi:hypothetical protein